MKLLRAPEAEDERLDRDVQEAEAELLELLWATVYALFVVSVAALHQLSATARALDYFGRPDSHRIGIQLVRRHINFPRPVAQVRS
jgi:hypothetical protein